MATTTLRLASNGAIAGYTSRVVRLHSGAGTNGLVGEVYHIYCGVNIDDRFQTARFTVGGVPVPHRRFRVQKGISADFLLRLDIPASGSIDIVVDYVASGRTTESTDAAVLLWGLDGWRRANGSGLLMARQGAEVSVIRENGKIRIWYTHLMNGGAGPFEIRYRETTDPTGLTGWTDPALCIAAGLMHTRVTKGPDGRYHLLGARNPPGRYADYYVSDTGDPGTWTLDTASVIDYGGNNYAGNQHPIWDAAANEWKVFADCYLPGLAAWGVKLFTGPDLRTLTSHPSNPIRGGDGVMHSGGRLFRKADGTWCYLGHNVTRGGNSGTGLPTDLYYSEAPAAHGPWTEVCRALQLQEYHGSINLNPSYVIPDAWAVGRPVSDLSQLGDPGWYEEDGLVRMFYEDCFTQAQTWTIGMAEWDAPMSRITDPAITHARMDDVEAEGWSPTDVTPTSIPAGAHFRKMTRNTYLGHPVSFEIKGPFETARDVTLGRDEVVINLAARNQTASSSFTACRVDTAAGAPLAAIVLDSDGHFKAYDGAGTRELGAYWANLYYAIRLVLWTTGYDVVIDGVTVASGLSYRSAWARPGRLAIGLSAATYAYVGELFVTPAVAPALVPTWEGEPLAPDTTPPVITSFTVPASPHRSAAVPVVIVATEDVGLPEYAVTVDDATVPVAFQAGGSRSITLTNGVHTLRAYARDTAGNVSDPAVAEITVVLPAPNILAGDYILMRGSTPYILMRGATPQMFKRGT